MQGTSANYRPYVDEIRTDALIEFSLIDVDASKVASSSASAPAMSFTQVRQTHDDITQNSMKLATLDRNLWKLDGSFSLPNHIDNLETGYFSSILSDDKRNIDLTITFNFDEYQSSNGFTLIFDTKAEEVASDFTVETSTGGSYTITGNKRVQCVVPLQSKNYNWVSIHFTKTAKPYRRVRLTEFVFGQQQQFFGDRIKDLRVTYEAGLYMEKMPANKIQFTIDNSDRSYNILNPTGIFAYLQEGQGINASIYINGESVSMGRFYFDSASANDDALTATVTGYDLLWRLDKSECNIGTTGTWTVQQAVEAIVADSGVELTINIPTELGARVVGKNIPKDTSHREALRMVAQAGMLTLYFNRIGELKAKVYDWNNPVDALSPRNMRGWGEAKANAMVNNVVVRVRNEYAGTEQEYIANDRIPGEPLQTLTVDIPLATSQAVADWVLACVKHRNIYNSPAQSNPARDIGDCISISNVYGYSDNTVIVKQDTVYDGSLLDTVVAYGGGQT